MAFVQLAANRNWIDTTMRLDTTDLQTAQWVSAVPEPLTAPMWLAGPLVAAGMGAHRRRSQSTRRPAQHRRWGNAGPVRSTSS